MNDLPFYEDIFNDLSKELDEQLALHHLLLQNKGLFVILGSRQAFQQALKKREEEVVRNYQEIHQDLTSRN